MSGPGTKKIKNMATAKQILLAKPNHTLAETITGVTDPKKTGDKNPTCKSYEYGTVGHDQTTCAHEVRP